MTYDICNSSSSEIGIFNLQNNCEGLLTSLCPSEYIDIVVQKNLPQFVLASIWANNGALVHYTQHSMKEQPALNNADSIFNANC